MSRACSLPVFEQVMKPIMAWQVAILSACQTNSWCQVVLLTISKNIEAPIQLRKEADGRVDLYLKGIGFLAQA
jgi:hypothetical protein